jgi:type I restriction enzyme S subunit
MRTDLLQKDIPNGWKLKKLSDVLDYERPDKYIVKSTSYSNKAKTPVLTANKSFILGYTDEDFGVYKNLPAIIFDDFTTDSKLVNFPFKIKSSAIKILKEKNKDIDLRFVFEKMKSVTFPTGSHKRFYISQYQNLEIAMPPIKEQQKIAEILGAVDEDIAKTQEVIEATEKLKRGLMQQLFTRGIRNAKFKVSKLGDLCIFKTGKLNSNKAVDGGVYPFFTCSQETFAIDQYSFDQKAILLAGNNAAGKYSVKYYDGKFDAYQRTYVISIKNEDYLSYPYLKEVLNTRLNELRDSSVGSTTKFLTLKLLENLSISLPPISEQREIAEILASINEKISVNKKLKAKLTLLKKGLMQDLLSGKVRTDHLPDVGKMIK